jgi:hypothetical protein
MRNFIFNEKIILFFLFKTIFPSPRRLAVLCVEVMSKYAVDRKLGKRFMADFVERRSNNGGDGF